MKTWTHSTTLATSMLLLSLNSSPLLAQGSLTPPAGAPSPTMKSLDLVEARIPLDTSTNTSITISEPGSYYLTGNLTVTGHNGIVISASQVTLDLNGFVVKSTDASTYGIYVGKSENIVVKNGAIDNFEYGVFFRNVSNGSISDIRVSNTTKRGITLNSYKDNHCSNNLITQCSVNNSAGSGITVSGQGTMSGNRIELCSISGCATDGIRCFAYLNGTVRGTKISLCSVVNSGGSGIHLDGYAGTTNENNAVEGCTSYDTGDFGIEVRQAKGMIVSNNTTGNTQNTGIYFSTGHGNQIRRNTVRDAQGKGIEIGAPNASIIENNHVSNVTSSSTSFGIDVANGTASLIGKNSSVGQNDNFHFTSGHSMGSENSVYGEIGAAYSTLGAPWTNFSVNQTP